MDTNELRLHLSAGRAHAVRRMPYLSVAMYSMQIHESRQLETAAVDSRWRFYYNPDFIAGLTIEEVATVWVHEIGHLLRDHHQRAKRHFVPDHERHTWNRAGDATINADLRDHGLFPTFSWMVFPENIDPDAHPNQTTEQYYNAATSGGPPPAGGTTPDDEPDGNGEPDTDGSTPGEPGEQDDTDTGDEGGPDGSDGETEPTDTDDGDGGGAGDPSDDADPSDGAGEGEGEGGDPTADGSGGTDGEGDGDGDPAEGSESGGEQCGEPGEAGGSGQGEGDGTPTGGAPGLGTDCGSAAGGDPRDYEAPTDETTISEGRGDRIRSQTAQATIEHENRHPGTVPAGMARWANEVMKPQVDWRRELRSAVRKTATAIAGRTDYTYERTRRVHSAPQIIFPATTGSRPPRVAAIVDTSGSMKEDHISQVLAEVRAISSRLSREGDPVAVISCDVAIKVQKVRGKAPIELEGGGGTDMRVGLAEAASMRPQMDLIITLTDGFTPWPEIPPEDNPSARYLAVIVSRTGKAPPEKWNIPDWMKTIVLEPGALG